MKKHLFILFVFIFVVTSTFAQPNNSKNVNRQKQKQEQASFSNIEVMNKELIKSVNHNQFERVKDLITHGADVNTKDSLGMPVLSLANIISLINNPRNFEIEKFLISKGADVNARDREGNTLLRSVIVYKNGSSAESVGKLS